MKEYVKFRLKAVQKGVSESKQVETSIFLYFRNSSYSINSDGFKRYEEFKLSTGQKIKPAHWDFSNQRAKQTYKVDYVTINSELNKLENLVHKTHLDNRNLEPRKIKKLIKDKLEGKNSNKFLCSYSVEFYEDCKKGDRLTNINSRYKEASLSRIHQFVLLLERFQRHYNKSYVFKEIDLEFYYQFKTYLLDEGYTPNTIGKHVRMLKQLMKLSLDEKLHNNSEFVKFKDINVEADNIYLNEDEIELIYKLDLKNLPDLEQIRDIFIVGCDTALRFENLINLNETNVKSEGKMLEVFQVKTGNKICIPLTNRALILLKRHNFKFNLNSPTANKGIKIIGKMAGIDEKIEMKEWDKVKGENVIKIYHKYEKIVMHSSRRSACSNLYRRGLSALQIMSLSGHKTEKSFLNYIKVKNIENAKLLATNSFFTEN